MTTAVDAYLATLPEDRRAALVTLRDAIRTGLPEGYEEGLQYGMISWYVPHSRYPDGYHCDPKQPVPFASIAAQKSHLAVYLFCVYTDPALTAWFVDEYTKSGKKLDMGKSCVRFKKIEDAPVELFGQTVARVPVDTFLAQYTAQIPASAKKKVKK
jgi:uncharacterized protein YdhG (YjbR/CyaY superfamily)